ncbi:DUF3307 domain-containing protein [Colwellia sp. Arc7-635]|uniref:DUF3307 domain-containing protein n=1 Tax=Colwellia sp. Arc7-635 TaxID=2497879 RepID=UPI000F84F2C1|nr:DUF3307 domain-containing protein [Colwellia sp. Arc7-635]AZQ84628.1 DUF3307 domain-containing protein [Colwellia sp. Arc7-635]
MLSYSHAVIQAVASCIPILFVTTDWRSITCILIVIGVSHWLIDLGKTYIGGRLRYFIIDQILHIFVLTCVAIHASKLEWSISELAKATITEKSLIIALGYIVIFKPTSILIGSILTKYIPEKNEDNEGLISGGEIIGYLERALILTFAIIGQFSVIGFILAAKSIFRFGDLNSQKIISLLNMFCWGHYCQLP